MYFSYYVVVDNKQTGHQESIIEKEGKICGQVVSILIDHGSNYSYISPYLVGKCCMNK